MTDELTIEQKLDLFESASKFQISENISLELKTKEPSSKSWGIFQSGPGFCYDHKSDEWEYEPHPSSRDTDFISGTRYYLHEAIEIVNSPGFIEKYRNP